MTDTRNNKAAQAVEPAFDGSFGCTCGNIRVDVLQPRSSIFVSPTAAMCQCSDCFGFASTVSQFRKENCPESSDKADALTDANATDMRQIYKSDAAKLTGQEYLRGVKLQEDSPCVRYYSTCCGTPLLISYTVAPFFLVYQHTIQDGLEGFKRLAPTVVLNHQSAPPNSTPTPDGIPIHDGVSLGFISHAVARAIFGMLAGKKTSPIGDQLDTIPIRIGLESIRNQDDTA